MKFDFNDGLEWERNGVITTVYQEQGLDIVTTQSRKGMPHSCWLYSDPGLHLFAAVLNYHRRQLGEPDMKEIRHILGEQYTFRGNGFPVNPLLLADDVTRALAQCVDGIIIGEANPIHIGGHMGVGSYHVF
ncbi:MAG: hypothetical protein ACE5DM_04215 [Candidatus Nanoarchaeia archaeon]